MSRILVLAITAGCTQPDASPCESDAECGSSICARSHECVLQGDVREVHVSWTVAGQVASESTCANSPVFTVEFQTAPPPDGGERLDFKPVSCSLGRFTVDKLPSWFWIAGVESRE